MAQETLRAESHVCTFDAKGSGLCRFVWDNSLTWMFSKNLTFNVATVALPVAEAPAASPNDGE